MNELRILPCSTENYIYEVIYTRSLGNYHIGNACEQSALASTRAL